MAVLLNFENKSCLLVAQYFMTSAVSKQIQPVLAKLLLEIRQRKGTCTCMHNYMYLL